MGSTWSKEIMPKVKMMLVLALVLFVFKSATTFACSNCEGHRSVPDWVWNIETPSRAIFTGEAVFYAPGVMERVIEVRSQRGLDPIAQHRVDRWYDGEYLGAVSAMSPSDMWKEIWIKAPHTGRWEGPYLVVDCAQQNHIYRAIAVGKEIIEVDFDTAERWGMVSSDASGNWIRSETASWSETVSVYIGNKPPTPKIKTTYNYPEWWLSQWN